MVKHSYVAVRVGEDDLGIIDLVLYDDDVPKTVDNFIHFLQARDAPGYLNSTFHRIIPGFMAQGGDFITGDGTGSTSIYNDGNSFADENFNHRHDRPGVLSMANSGPNSNGCQFFITFRPTPHLDGRHVVFGYVNQSNPNSRATLKALEKVQTDRNDRPLRPVRIVDCGLTGGMEESPVEKVVPEKTTETTFPDDKNVENSLSVAELGDYKVDNDDDDNKKPKSKAEALKRRMRKLKLKMNQARQLNKQEVLREGERLGSVEGATKVRKRQQVKDKKNE